MNTFTKTVAVIGMTLGLAGIASASTEFVATDNAVGTKICVAAVQGSKFKLREAIEDAGVSKRYVANEMKCNGVPIVEFVAQHSQNAESINSFIAGNKYKSDAFIASVNTAN